MKPLYRLAIIIVSVLLMIPLLPGLAWWLTTLTGYQFYGVCVGLWLLMCLGVYLGSTRRR